MEIDENLKKLLDIFFPEFLRRKHLVENGQIDFIHYTTADAAVKIIGGKKFWLRDIRAMNDWKEIQHGIECFRYVINRPIGQKLVHLLGDIGLTFEQNLTDDLTKTISNLYNHTYIACLSEHTKEDDKNGRLSMLRGYSEAFGVGLVFHPQTLLLERPGLNGVFVSSVLYADFEIFEHNFSEVVENLSNEIDFIKKFDFDKIKFIFLRWFMFAIACTKHIGFQEEKEWRLLYFPLIEYNNLLSFDIETIRGLPQIVHKLEMINKPEEGIEYIDIKDNLKKVILGPSFYQDVLGNAFIYLMNKNGFENTGQKVFASGIPLRP
jgi:hypothetical protein